MKTHSSQKTTSHQRQRKAVPMSPTPLPSPYNCSPQDSSSHCTQSQHLSSTSHMGPGLPSFHSRPWHSPSQAKEGCLPTAKATTPALHSTRGLPHHTCAHQGWRQRAPVWACLAACHLHQSRHSGGTTPAETTRQNKFQALSLTET